MTDQDNHRHELGQGFNISHMTEYVYCIHCRKRWSKSAVTNLINAVERLSPDIALKIADHKETTSDRAQLRLYARELEGE